MRVPIETLSDVERQLLMNQFRILAKLDPDKAGSYENSLNILARGYTIEYHEAFDWMDEETPLEECRYVVDVLKMYDRLIVSFRKLEDKEGLTADDVKFKGFDERDEGKHLAFAEYLKRTEGDWDPLKKDLKSHYPVKTMGLYPRMLQKYEPIRQEILLKRRNEYLTADEIKEIISYSPQCSVLPQPISTTSDL